MKLSHFFLLLFFLLIVLFQHCKPSSNQEKGGYQEQNEGNSTGNHHKNHRKKHERFNNDNGNSEYASGNRTDANKSEISTGNVPINALNVLKYIHANGVAMSGYIGGRRFGNFEGLLPKKDASGKQIGYQEWDVNPKTQGKNRGVERLITGSDGKGYYTNDHYKSFSLVE